MEVVAVFLRFICTLIVLNPLLLQISASSSSPRDAITPSQPLMDNQTIVSSSQTFALGFFSPNNSKNYRYLGIWFNKIPIRTIVWVANRENTLNDSSGVLKINSNGDLVLVDQNEGRVIWSSSSVNHSIVENPIAQLLDTGNLIIKSESKDDHKPNSYIWESFDYPSHNFISGVKLGWNLKTGLNRKLTSWKSSEDPAPGNFTLAIDPRGNPQVILQNRSSKFFRLGPWNGVQFSGFPVFTYSPYFQFVNNKEEIYTTFNDVSVFARVELKPSGSIHFLVWDNQSPQWNVLSVSPHDRCSTYGLCGVNGICNIEETIVCKCLKGFVPKSPEKGDRVDWSSGCRRLTPLASDCSKVDDGFAKIPSVKLPDTTFSWVNTSMTLDECEMKCKNNCSCSAYANSDIRGGGSGCVLWFGDLLDIREFAAGTGQDLYVRMAASELGVADGGSNDKKRVTVIKWVSGIMGMLLFISIICYIFWKTKQRGKRSNQEIDSDIEIERETELPLFDFGTIVKATYNFSCDKILGEGGFGPVYKGKLSNEQEIAVKRLSKNSRQGLNEFKNEVILIAKLQHRNLVRLLGCCIQRKEMMLIYEHMPNKGLDSFIFDQAKSTLLSWQKRFEIITGIAQGLLYLHRDSRLRIIHRDLKASNVLLDSKMNPKISDFGLARTFGGDQTQANTARVVGTFGYMSPEYAVDGIFSMKSDVFSFGVLMLEIVSGERNRGIFHHHGNNLNLLGHAWKLWCEDKALELLDKVMEDKFNRSEVLRCIQVGLLCVQLYPEDRPTMSSVVMMLGSDSAILFQPKQPGFFYTECSSSSSGAHSGNKMSMTGLEGR